MPETESAPVVQVTQTLEALGHFAGGIAHDVNNILSIIEGYAARARRLHAEGAAVDEMLQGILLATERGGALTRQLLAFARQNIDLVEGLSLAEALAQQKILLKPLLGDGIVLSLPEVDGPVYLGLSSAQFTQVMLNLAVNARDAMQGQGVLTISYEMLGARDPRPPVRAPGPLVRISVSDTGRGIPKDILPRIFEPFFTTKSPVGSGRSGTGLGLSVVYGIVDQVGGAIRVRSREGQGASFDLYLPLAAPAATIAESSETAGATLAGRTVILAEDEPELRDVLTMVLQDMQMRVLPVANGNEALRVQADYDGDIDFLLTDVVMPGMDGLQLSDLFMTARPQTNVVLMSGYPLLEGGGTLPPAEKIDFLRKPFNEDMIRQVLERALVRKAARLDRQQKSDPQQ